MRRSTRRSPSLNTGSMADIAFLLLIFFLVTATIPDDAGFQRMLPKPCPPGVDCTAEIKEHNILRIIINPKNEIMVNESVIHYSDLNKRIKQFVDNNKDGTCTYCLGSGDTFNSDNPKKAVISIQAHPKSSYSTFILLQDELSKAFKDMRLSYAKRILNKSESQLTPSEIAHLRSVYPFLVSEAQTR